MDTASHPGLCGQDGTDLVVHDDHVSQRITHGNKVVIGHNCVQKTLSRAQEIVEEELGNTTLKKRYLDYALKGISGAVLKGNPCQTWRGFPRKNTKECETERRR